MGTYCSKTTFLHVDSSRGLWERGFGEAPPSPDKSTVSQFRVGCSEFLRTFS